MTEILENIAALWPYLVTSWLLVLGYTLCKPQRYFNSILLMIAGFFTMLFVCGLFGQYMSIALMVCFLIVMCTLFLVPVMLITNGIDMLRKEAFSLAHLLSLILGVGVAIGEIATVVYVFTVDPQSNNMHLHAFTLLISFTVFYFSCLVLNFVLYSVFIQVLPHRMKFDYVIIHGCGLLGGNRMSKLLSNRVDKAIEIYNKCEVKPIIIPSGGQGSDEKLSEAQAMKNYLLEHGIAEDKIIMEDRSKTTLENLQNSKAIIDSMDAGKRVALVSSNYHIYRCLTYAKKAGLDCVGVGAKVAFYFWPSALIREFIAVFVSKRFLIWALIGYFIVVLPIISLFL